MCPSTSPHQVFLKHREGRLPCGAITSVCMASGVELIDQLDALPPVDALIVTTKAPVTTLLPYYTQ